MNEPLLRFLKEYWFVVIFLGSLVMGWTTFQSNLTQLDSRITKVEVKSDADTATLASFNIQLAQIQTTLEFIKQQIAKK